MSKRPRSDLIERMAVLDICHKKYWNGADNYYPINARKIEKEVRQLPSAELAIIYCKDCKYYDGRPCGIVGWYNTDSDFCSRAERRDK